MRIWTLSFLCFLLGGTILQAEVSFRARVDKLQTSFEEKVTLELEVTVTSADTKTSPIPPPEIIGFRVGGSGSSVERRGEQIVRKYSYDLFPQRSGEVTIPPFRVEYQEGGTTDTLKSDPIIVSVAKPVPPKKPLPMGVKYGIPALVVIAVVAVAARRKLAKQPEQPVEADWRDEYRAKLAEVRKTAERQDFRKFSSEIMRLVVSIIERIYETRLSGFTGADIVRWLEEKGADKELLGYCRDLFAFCEGVKFTTGFVDLQQGLRAVNDAEKIVELLLK